MGTTLFIIDPQHDFMDIDGAALPVPGAMMDMTFLGDLLYYHPAEINRIVVALDQHPLNHIAHAHMWMDDKGRNPEPFSRISHDDSAYFRWNATNPALHYQMSAYLLNLERGGGVHVIWPMHCIIGSHGATIYEPLMRALDDWWTPKNELLLFPKSGYWCSEQFSSFRAAVEVPDEPSTHFNYKMRDAIIDDTILIAGEALNFCVAASVMDAIRYTPDIDLAKRMILLRDCTSNVKGFEDRSKQFLDEFQQAGGRVMRSTEVFPDPAADDGAP